MKNRLQFRYHSDVFFNREMAYEYLTETINNKYDQRSFSSLIAEPLVAYYADANGDTQVLFLIGVNGNGTQPADENANYFILDGAKLNEEIAELQKNQVLDHERIIALEKALQEEIERAKKKEQDLETSINKLIRNLESETEARKAVDGQPGPKYVANLGTTAEPIKFITGATSLNSADMILDQSLQMVEDKALVNINVNGVDGTVEDNIASVVIGGKDIVLTDYTMGTNFHPVTKTDTVNSAFGKVQVQIDATQKGAGLNEDCTYNQNVSATYIKDAKSIHNATEILDETITNLYGGEPFEGMDTIHKIGYSIKNEVENRVSADEKLSEAINKNKTDIATINTYSVNNKLIKTNPVLNGGDVRLDNYIAAAGVSNIVPSDTINIGLGKVETRAKQVQINLDGETKRATEVENTLNTNVNILSGHVSTLQIDLDKAEDDILTEMHRAVEAERTLQTNLDTEIRRATDAEKVLTNNVNTLSGHVSTLQIDLDKAEDDIHTLKVNLTKETNRATASEKELSDRITVNAEDIDNLESGLSNLTTIVNNNKIINADGSINLIPSNGNTDLSVRIAENDNALKLTVNGLFVDKSALTKYEGENAIVVDLPDTNNSRKISLKINAYDKVLVNDGAGLRTDISMVYEKEHQRIRLYGRSIDGEPVVVSEINVADFITDGMIEDVKYDKSKSILTITWNTASGLKPTEIDFTDLIDVYAAGNGLKLDSNNKFHVVVDEANCDKIDNVPLLVSDEKGVRVIGITSAIDKVNNSSNMNYNLILAEAERAKNVENNLSVQITEERSRALLTETQLQNNIDAEITARENADEIINNKVVEISNKIETLTINNDNNANAITNEINRATAAEKTLENSIKTETIARENADNILTNKVNGINETVNVLVTDVDNVEKAVVNETNRATKAEQSLENSINTEIAERTNADNVLTDKVNVLTNNLSKSNENITANANAISNEIKRASESEIKLENAIAKNKTSIELLNAEYSVNGSVKHMIDDAMIALEGMPSANDALNITLMRQVPGTGTFYVSNDTKHMMHDGNILSNVIDGIVDDTNNNTKEVDALKDRVATLETQMVDAQARITTLENELNELKSEFEQRVINIISKTIVGVDKETMVTNIYAPNAEGVEVINRVQIGFDSDAIFNANTK